MNKRTRTEEEWAEFRKQWVADQQAQSEKSATQARKPWTPGDDQYVWDTWYNPISTQARVLGRTYNSVAVRRNKIMKEKSKQ